MENRQKAKEIFYYFRHQKTNAPLITVCVVEVPGEKFGSKFYGRGISICSLKDNPCKKEGRKRARARAYAAVDNKFTGRPIVSPCEIDVVSIVTYPDIICSFTNKIDYLPVLTDFEKDRICRKLTNSEIKNKKIDAQDKSDATFIYDGKQTHAEWMKKRCEQCKETTDIDVM